MKKHLVIALITILLTLIIDQWIKVYIKLNFYYGESYSVFGEWFQLYFVENEGMAFGWKIPFIGRVNAKILLSLFRLIACGVIVYYIVGLIKRKVTIGLLISVCLIFAGAFGNIIDSLLYGLIFSDSPSHLSVTAELVPIGEGYAGFLTGKVVDMFQLSFFPPIFNFADVTISVGVGMIILFQRTSFQTEFFAKKEVAELEGDSESVTSEEELSKDSNHLS